MTIYPIYTCTCMYISFFFMFREQINVRSEKTHSLFSFSFTNAISPNHIEDSCLVIDNSTLFSKYFGVQLFITHTIKSVSCKPENIELKEIRKYIIHAEKARLLCRTTLTVSMSSTQCEKSIVDLRRVCHDQTPIKTSIYFQECEEVDYHDKKAFTNGTMTITMSAFSTPTNSRFGLTYEIPRVQCSRKKRMSTKRAANHSRVIPLACKVLDKRGDVKFSETLTMINVSRFKLMDITSGNITCEYLYDIFTNLYTIRCRERNGKQLIQDDAKQGYTIFVVCGSGLLGLVEGILITLMTCSCVQKCKNRRNNSDGLLSRSNSNLISEGEGRFSIHSNKNFDVYHYIADASHQEEGSRLFNVSETVVYDYATQQQCNENLRNSTSGQGNPSDNVQVYHTLYKDSKVGSEKPEKILATVLDSMYTKNDLRYKDVFQMSSSENHRYISYEENWYQSVSPDKSLPPETHERVSSGVYNALQKKEELNSTASLNDTPTELHVNTGRDGK